MKKIIAVTLIMCLFFAITTPANQLDLSLENQSVASIKGGGIMIAAGLIIALIGFVIGVSSGRGQGAQIGASVVVIGLGFSLYGWRELIQEERAERIVSWSKKAQETMESWLGEHESDLIASWGPPNKIMPDGKGGTVLDYSHYRDFGYRGYIDRFGNFYGYPLGYTANRYFYVDSNGIIYNFKWKGL